MTVNKTHTKPYMYRGKAFMTISSLALEADVSLPTLSKKMNMYPNLSIEEIIEKCKERAHQEILYQGKYYTRTALAKKLNVHAASLCRELKKHPELGIDEIIQLLLSRKHKKGNGRLT